MTTDQIMWVRSMERVYSIGYEMIPRIVLPVESSANELTGTVGLLWRKRQRQWPVHGIQESVWWGMFDFPVCCLRQESIQPTFLRIHIEIVSLSAPAVRRWQRMDCAVHRCRCCSDHSNSSLMPDSVIEYCFVQFVLFVMSWETERLFDSNPSQSESLGLLY